MNLSAILSKAWRFYANVAGVLIVGAVIAWGLLSALSHDGPVVETVEGPDLITETVPFGGELSFRLSVRRVSSCPGLVIHRFVSLNNDQPGTLIVPAVIKAPDIKTTRDMIVRFKLPPSIFSGQWRYEYSISSECPTFSRNDQLAVFVIEVK